MSKAISLHIGLNSLDPAHYDGWAGPLNACEADSNSMRAICTDRGFSAETLKTADVTRDAALGRLQELADSLEAGDTLMVSYARHGSQMPDEYGDEDDGLDETWCLFDGQLLDDELYHAWARFPPGIRIAVFSDSCHSGTVVRNMVYGGRLLPAMLAGYRVMPPEMQVRTSTANREFYRDLLAKPGTRRAALHGRACVGLPGQSALKGRHFQRRLHRSPVAGVEQRSVPGRLRGTDQGSTCPVARGPVAQFHDRRRTERGVRHGAVFSN